MSLAIIQIAGDVPSKRPLKLLKSFGWSTLATFSTVACSLSFYKMFSLFLGPPGIALLSHLQNLLALCTTVPQEGVNRGTVKYLSGTDANGLEYQSHFKSAIFLQLLVYLCTIPIMFLLLQQTVHLPEFLKSGYFFGLFCLGVFFQLGLLFLFSLILSEQNFKKYSLLSIANSFVMVLIVFAGIRNGAEWGCAALLFANIPILCLLVLLLFKNEKVKINWSKGRITKNSIKDISRFLLLACCTLIFGRLVDFWTRLYVLSAFDVYSTGLWQSAVKISDGYSSLFSGILGSVFFPKIAAVVNAEKNVRPLFLKTCSLVFPIILAGLLAVYFFKDLLLLAIFDKDFIPAIPFLNYQVYGDVFKLSSWFMMYLVLAKTRIKTYIVLELISASFYLLLLYLFTGKYGVVGVSFAYIGRHCIYFFLVLTVTYLLLFPKFRPREQLHILI